LKTLQNDPKALSPASYAADFIKQLQLDPEVESKCEWTCLLWSKEHWADEARKAQVTLELTKEHTVNPQESLPERLFLDSQFHNTVAQVYSKLFGCDDQTCGVKVFDKCPFLGQRQDLLNSGSLASVFVTILHKATLYAMLDRHPLDSGLLSDEYDDVYGINLANFPDLESSLTDGRFQLLYEAVLMRAKQIAGISQ
jgi:hypothetical protein